jgi:hypothetical protein
MIEFLKNLLGTEKTPAPKQRDVIVLDAYATNDDEEEQSGGGCGSGGCGSCGCG